MADITNVEATLNAGETFSFSAGAASQTFEFGVPDEKLIVLVKNEDDDDSESAYDATVTFEAGDFLQSGYGDIEVEVTDTDPLAVVVLESGIVKDEDGEVTVTVTDSDGSGYSGTEADVKIAVIEL